MRENALATLRVVNGSASQISTDRNPNHAWRRKPVVGAPADQRKFIAQLHHGGPDVVEELNLDHRLHPARGHADRATHDVRFRQRRIEYAIGTEVVLQAES